MEITQTNSEEAKEEITMKYVAFCDILGFSNKVFVDFDATLEVYKRFGERLEPELFEKRVNLTMYSDAILMTADDLPKLLGAVQVLWFIAMTENLMIRGGIAYGKYWERRHGNHLMVVSDALVRAVKLESTVGVPAVVLADDIQLGLDAWIPRLVDGPFATPLLHFRDRNIVNPFSVIWGTSAATRASMMMDESPAHKDKYLWFLALYKAVSSDTPLIPPAILHEMIEKKLLAWHPAIPAEAPINATPSCPNSPSDTEQS